MRLLQCSVHRLLESLERVLYSWLQYSLQFSVPEAAFTETLVSSLNTPDSDANIFTIGSNMADGLIRVVILPSRYASCSCNSLVHHSIHSLTCSFLPPGPGLRHTTTARLPHTGCLLFYSILQLSLLGHASSDALELLFPMFPHPKRMT